MTSIRTDMGVALLTKEGGTAFPSINGTGSTSVPGTLAIQSTSSDETFLVAPADSGDCIGIIYNAVADGEVAWIVYAGRTPVLLQTGTGCFSGESLVVSTTENGKAVAGGDYKVIGITTEAISAPAAGESASVMAIISIGRGGMSAPPVDNFWSYFPAGFY